MRGIGRSRSTARGEGCVKKRAATRNRGPALRGKSSLPILILGEPTSGLEPLTSPLYSDN